MGVREVPRGRDCHLLDLAERPCDGGRRDDGSCCYQSHVAKESLARPRWLDLDLSFALGSKPPPGRKPDRHVLHRTRQRAARRRALTIKQQLHPRSSTHPPRRHRHRPGLFRRRSLIPAPSHPRLGRSKQLLRPSVQQSREVAVPG